MNTLSHQWLATAFIPRSVIDKVLAEMEAAREAQIGINSEWDEGESESRNPTLTNTKGMSKEEIAFYNLFWEVNVPSMQAYVKEHPDALAAGWSRINIDKSALKDDGTSIRTIQGEQVLAIDARNKILIARVKGSTYRGVLVIMKDPSRLSLQAASTLGSVGQVCGKIGRGPRRRHRHDRLGLHRPGRHRQRRYPRGLRHVQWQVLRQPYGLWLQASRAA